MFLPHLLDFHIQVAIRLGAEREKGSKGKKGGREEKEGEKSRCNG